MSALFSFGENLRRGKKKKTRNRKEERERERRDGSRRRILSPDSPDPC